MNERFPALIDVNGLPRRVLAIAPHADDEVLGCGGLLAGLAARGDDVRVLVLTAREGDERARESLAAARELGVGDLRFAGFEDGRLGAATELVERLAAEITEFDPGLVLAPSPLEIHPDHRATAAAAASALARGAPRRVLLYGVNVPLTGGVLVDVTARVEAKQRALACFASQTGRMDLAGKSAACDRARTINVDDPAVEAAEGFVDLSSGALLDEHLAAARLRESVAPSPNGTAAADWAATAVISNWNKKGDLRENLAALRAQTRPFAAVIVVDNASSDGSAEMVAAEFPEVRLTVMPHSAYGACETFNLGFASAHTPLIAILDDDVVLPPEWLEKTVERLQREPETTALISTEVIEPGMPEAFVQALEVGRERYMSTFRGCASLARAEPLRRAGWYDERLFIYGNERDLTCRLLNQGCRVLHYPAVRAFHKTPFGIKMGKRSLYYHARNAWLSMLKYAPAGDLVRLPWLVLTRVVLRGDRRESAGEVADATGTIGIGRSLRETPGAWWVLVKAAASVLANVPYCLRRRAPVRAPDFELPIE